MPHLDAGVLFNRGVSSSPPSAGPSPRLYRLSSSLVVRLVGAALVVTALLVLVATLVTAVAGSSLWPVVAVAVVGVAAAAGLAWWLVRRAYVVRVDDVGYDVRLLRGPGVRRARWADVAAVSTAEVAGLPSVVVALRDGETTTLPMAAIAADRDEFLTNLRNRLPRSP